MTDETQVERETALKEEGFVADHPAKSNEAKEPTYAELQAQVAELANLVRSTTDKGRLLKYDSRKQGKKPIKVHLSNYKGGLITGWRTLKDVLIKHPSTGRVVGEEQQYELLILMPDGKVEKDTINSYQDFSDARYTSQIEVEVVGKKEDWDGNTTFTLKLPDGRDFDIDSRFIN